jgi:drug/metabolite transporter (DMT)-like permease
LVLPFGWDDLNHVDWPLFQWSHFASLTAIVFTGTFLAYFFNIYGIQHLGAGVTGSYIYTQPIFAAIIAVIFSHEKLTSEKIFSGILIFTGVFLVSSVKKSFNKGLGVIEE